MKGIIFKTDMVRALLNTNFKTYPPEPIDPAKPCKGQMRRVLSPQPILDEAGMWHWKDCQWMDDGLGFPQSGTEDHARYKVGEVYYIKESTLLVPCIIDGVSVIVPMFEADFSESSVKNMIENGIKKASPISFRHKSARLFMRQIDIRMERLHDITDADCIMEGVAGCSAYMLHRNGLNACRDLFKQLWNRNHRIDGNGWDTNPWVWVYSFEKVKDASFFERSN